MKIKLFLDTADINQMRSFYHSGKAQGFTTNPSLMRQAGVENYLAYAKEVASLFPDFPLSLEVFADDMDGMYQQALKLAALGKNIYVKIPITNTQKISTYSVIEALAQKNIPLNITAIFTVAQVEHVVSALRKEVPAIISIFSGRIANAGVDPVPICAEAVTIAKHLPLAETLWASSREAFNVIQAEEAGCHIITMTPDLLKATENFGKDLTEYSLETVKMFFNDATKAGYVL